MPTMQLGLSFGGAALSDEILFDWVTLQMSLQGHHIARLRLVSSAEKEWGDARSTKLDEVFRKLGEKATLELVPLDEALRDRKLVFNGYVSAASHEVENDGTRGLVLTLLSPTAQLDAGPRCCIWENKSPLEIADSIISKAPLVTADTAGLPSDRISYEAQFEESDYVFLGRLAGRFSCWTYYDGDKLYFARSLQGRDSHTLSVVRDGKSGWLQEFTVEARLVPGAFQQDYFLAKDKSRAKADQSATTVSPSHPYVRLTQDASRKVFSRPSHPLPLGKVDSASDQKKQATSMVQSWARALVVARGRTTHPGLRPGSNVTVTGTGGDEDASYVVECATHRYERGGGYHCDVQLIPADVAFPPVASPPTAARLHRAQVIENYDPNNAGMVKVRYSRAVDGDTDEGFNETGDAVTTWVRVLTAHGGEQHGFVALPEPGDEVLVAHVGGRATHPVILGALYSAEKKSPVFNEIQPDISKNDGKAFLTKSGNLVRFSDASGKETIELRSPKGKNLLRMTLDGGAQVVVETEGLVHIKAKKTVTIESDGDMKLDSKGRMTLSSVGDMNLTGMNISASANQELKIEGMNVKASGSVGSELSGAKVDVKGQTLVTVQGALVKIN